MNSRPLPLPWGASSPNLILRRTQAQVTALLASAAQIAALPVPSLIVESNGAGSLLSVRAKVAPGSGTNTILSLASIPPEGRTILPSNLGIGMTVTLSVPITAGAPATVPLPLQDFGFRVDGGSFQCSASFMGVASTVQNGGGTTLAEFDTSATGNLPPVNLATSNAEAVAKGAAWNFVRTDASIAGRLILNLTITSV